MEPLAIAAAFLVFVTVLFLFMALFSGGASRQSVITRQRLDVLTRGAAEPQVALPPATLNQRLITPMFAGVVRILNGVLPKSLLTGVQRKLVIAGEPMTLNGFLTMVAVATTASVGFGLLIVVAMGAQIGLVPLGTIVVLACVGFFMPFNIVNSRARQRQTAIIKKLPDAFDLITTCVEAGLGLDAALTRVAEKVEGPFSDELARSLRDIALGKSRRDALRELGDRTQVPDLMQFVNSVIQAETMGSSVGQVLRVQAAQLRVRRRQRAEEQAYKAPVKMMFPMVLCIFPTLFIVILGPAIITIKEGFG